MTKDELTGPPTRSPNPKLQRRREQREAGERAAQEWLRTASSQRRAALCAFELRRGKDTLNDINQDLPLSDDPEFSFGFWVAVRRASNLLPRSDRRDPRFAADRNAKRCGQTDGADWARRANPVCVVRAAAAEWTEGDTLDDMRISDDMPRGLGTAYANGFLGAVRQYVFSMFRVVRLERERRP